jgi:UDPglucose 6-dehydrogenase
MRYESAELAKISINFCLVASVSVANTLVSETIGADWFEIMPALRLDQRIGPHAYLNPGHIGRWMKMMPAAIIRSLAARRLG